MSDADVLFLTGMGLIFSISISVLVGNYLFRGSRYEDDD